MSTPLNWSGFHLINMSFHSCKKHHPRLPRPFIIYYTLFARVVFPGGGTGGHVLVTELQGMTLNGLFSADVLRPLDLVPLTDFTYKYHSGVCGRI